MCDLSIVLWNINGLTVEKFRNIQSTILKFDIIALIETWHKDSSSNNFQFNGYREHFFNRTQIDARAKRGSGGIALYIKEHIYRGIEFITEPEFRKLDDRVWLKLKKDHFLN